jgi:hypothetical protein
MTIGEPSWGAGIFSLRGELLSYELAAPKQSKSWVMRLRGWAKETIRRELERLKVTRQEWLDCMYQFNWTCLNCGQQNLYNKEPGKEKLDYSNPSRLVNERFTSISS